MTKENEAIAVVGVSCLFPNCENIQDYWTTIKQGKNHVTEIPCTHWSPEEYYDSNPNAPDMTYAKTGAFLKSFDFNPLDYGITPASLEATDTTQLLGMAVAKQALEDAGYGEGRDYNKDRVSCILGVTGTLEMVIPLGARLGHPAWRKSLERAGLPEDAINDIVEDVGKSFVGWQEASFPGLLGNVVAGRIANRLDIGGTNSVVDAACASSLSAIRTAVMELQTHRADMAITGGMDTFNDIFMYMCFSKTPALSPTGEAKPFDAAGDGTILGEGLGAVILKRLSDAERDGDRIYALIRSIGSSSDGKGKAIYAPSAKGQVKALKNAYREAGVSPESIQLVECHGTGTKVGDGIELEALTEVYRQAKAEGTWCTLGSVKSQIGHTKAAAGVAGLIKALMALYHKTLPPTIKISSPHPQLAGSPFIIRNTPAPWLSPLEQPRRAAVSAFGFGGSNFHAVLEEYRRNKQVTDWQAGGYLLAVSGDSPSAIVRQLQDRLGALPETSDQGFLRESLLAVKDKAYRLALFAKDWGLLRDSIKLAIDHLQRGKDLSSTQDCEIFYNQGQSSGKLAVVFSGQGAQYPNMLGLTLSELPAGLSTLEKADQLCEGKLFPKLYPGQAFSSQEKKAQGDALANTSLAQPAIGAVSAILWNYLQSLGLQPEMVAGHSFGELTAMFAAGCIAEDDFLKLAQIRGQLMNGARENLGGMTVASGTYQQVKELLEQGEWDLVVANHNAPKQVVVSGDTDDLSAFEKAAKASGLGTKRLQVGAAFHSPIMASIIQPFHNALEGTGFKEPRCKVFSNVTASAYDPDDLDGLRKGLAEQLASEVRFVEEIENMYEEGARTFVEIGPSTILSGLIPRILDNKAVEVISCDSKKYREFQIDLLLARLFVAGVNLDFSNYRCEWQGKSRPKPSFSIPITGANYRDPKPTPSTLKPIYESLPRPAQATKQASPANRPVPTPKIEGASVMDQQPPATHSQPMPAIEKHLLAIQDMQQQNAALHKQFLENQAESQKIFYEVIQLYQGKAAAPTLETPPVSVGVPEPAPHANFSAPEMPVDSTPVAELPRVESKGAEIAKLSEPTPAPAVPSAVESAQLGSPESSATRVLEVIAECTGYPEASLNLDMDLEEDLGIDSIKRVEIFSRLQEEFPRLSDFPVEDINALNTIAEIIVATNGSPGAAGEVATPELDTVPVSETEAFSDREEKVLRVIAEKTGYPMASLSSQMNLEEDLGIDSIKRVEIISDLQEAFPSLAELSAEDLGEIATINELIFALEGQSYAADAGATSQSDPSLAVSPVVDAEKTVLEAIAEKTGYPLASLHLEMSLEEDLGIDSIKRVEILSQLGESYPQVAEAAQEDLAEIATIGELVAFIHSDISTEMPSVLAEQEIPALDSEVNPSQEKDLDAKEISSEEEAEPLEQPVRLDKAVLTIDDVEHLDRRELKLPVNAKIWVTDDGSNLARNIVLKLREKGFKPKLISTSFVDRMVAPEELDGLLILGPLKLEGSSSRFMLNCFKLVRLCASALMKEGEPKLFASISRNEGRLGIDGLNSLSQVFAGSLSGLAKTIRAEWPGIRAMHIDLGRDFADGFEAANRLIDACLSYDFAELGVHSHHFGLPKLKTETAKDLNSLDLSVEDVVVITGGARGVTAAVALEFAKKYPAQIVLWGRTNLDEELPAFISGDEDESELKKKILESGMATKPKEIQSLFNRFSSQIECRKNIAAMRQYNDAVSYQSVDCGNESDMRKKLESLQIEKGPLTGLIHGAGVLADRHLVEIKDEDFLRVVDTKIKVLNVVEKYAGQLKLLAMFSSSTARFGRKGQLAYAMSNEVLNKFVQLQRLKNPESISIAFNWGPWDGGMVNDGLKNLFAEEGIATIPLQEGAQFFMDELRDGRYGEVVLLAKPPQDKEEPLVVSLDSWPILRSHVIKNRGVVPSVILIEQMIAAARKATSSHFVGFSSFKVLKGVTVGTDESYEIKVEINHTENREQNLEVETVLWSRQRGESKWFPTASAMIQLSASPSESASPDADIFVEADGEVPTLAEVYDQYLFHGEELQGLSSLRAVTKEGAMGTSMTQPLVNDWLKDGSIHHWSTDPLALDVAFQLGVVWSERELGSKSLPTAIEQYQQFSDFPQEGCEIRLKVIEKHDHRFLSEIEFVKDDRLIAKIHGYSAVMDESLSDSFNRNEIIEPDTLG